MFYVKTRLTCTHSYGNLRKIPKPAGVADTTIQKIIRLKMKKIEITFFVMAIAVVIAIVASSKNDEPITAISKKMQGRYTLTCEVFFPNKPYQMSFSVYANGDTIKINDTATVEFVGPIEKGFFNSAPEWRFVLPYKEVGHKANEIVLQTYKVKLVKIYYDPPQQSL